MKLSIAATLLVQALARPGHHFAPLLNNGDRVDSMSQYDFVADLRNAEGSTICGGSFLDESESGYGKHWVLTAASCFRDADGQARDISKLNFVLGSVDRSGGQQYGLKGVQLHPKYNTETHAFDVALVQLDQAVEMEGVVGIQFVRDSPRVGASVTFVGFGDKYTHKYTDGGVRDMEHVGTATGHQLMVLGGAHHLCAPLLKATGLQYPRCAAFCVLQETGGGPCHNDAGGATLTADNVLAGVTSQPGNCGEKDKVTVVTSLSDKMDWLDCVRSGKPSFLCAQKGEDTDKCLTPGFSQKTCAELGWPVSQGVCAASKFLTAEKCTYAATFHEAEHICEEKGARLCRAEELVTGVATGTGCGFDFKRVWTRSPCGYGHSEEMLTVFGSPYGGDKTPRCTHITNHHEVRCCADESIDGPVVSSSGLPLHPHVSEQDSKMTCAQLGWSSGKGSVGVCAQSQFPLGPKQELGCPEPMTAAEAKDFCSEHSARLCTSAELKADEAVSSGCYLDTKRVWAADMCPLGAEGELVSQAGSNEYLPTHAKQCQPSGTKLPVRCCADALSGAASQMSWFSCTELGWPLKANKKACGSSLADWGCSLPMNYATASLKCAKAGARLCTDRELLNDVASSTGCHLDSKRVWTTTPCAGGVYTTAGSRRHGRFVVRKCTPLNAVANVRCCANRKVPGPKDANFPPRPSLPGKPSAPKDIHG